MKLTIQNMVCDRCIESVRNIFMDSGIPTGPVVLGSVETVATLDPEDMKLLSERLESKGFALILDRNSELVEKIKLQLIDYITHIENSNNPEKLSVFISGKLHYNYSYLSNIFSDITGDTVEGYLIKLKMERVKELLGYRTFTLSEIAWKLKYSSVQYLSNQFKKITRKTVTQYLNQKKADRKTIDRI